MPDVVSTNEDTAATFNVLTNDSDPDGDALTVTSNTALAQGLSDCGSDAGSFTYTPALQLQRVATRSHTR